MSRLSLSLLFRGFNHKLLLYVRSEEAEKWPYMGAVYQCCFDQEAYAPGLSLTHTHTHRPPPVSQYGRSPFLEECSGCSLLTERACCPFPVLTITTELFTFQNRLSPIWFLFSNDNHRRGGPVHCDRFLFPLKLCHLYFCFIGLNWEWICGN